jgi:hypothetical protein
VVARPTAMAITAVARRGVSSAAATVRVNGRHALDNTIAGEHASIGGEVLAHHEGAHSGILLSKEVRLVCEISLILAAVHKHKASEATGVSVTLVRRVSPSTTPTQT